MTQPTGPRPPLDVHGAVDLSSLGRPPAQTPGAPSAAVVDVTEATFADVVQRSTEVPVLITLWSAGDPTSTAVTSTLADVIGELGGRMLLARVDADRSPQVAQAVGSQTGSTVAAVVRGQAVPLPPLDQATREQVRSVLDQVLAMAAANGVTGTVQGGAPATEQEEPEEPPLPPLHQKAYEAIERDDLDGAADAYAAALQENPRDEMAQAGLAQVRILQRLRDVDAAAARAAAAADQADVEAQLVVADLDVMGGQVDDAFTRLLDVIRRGPGAEREAARVRLLELFTVVGDTDPRVMAARRSLASALY